MEPQPSQEDHVELEYSALNRVIGAGDRAVELFIYRSAGTEWTLEVVNHHNTSWVWDRTFQTDTEANEEFSTVLDTDGIDVFYAEPDDEDE